MAEKAGIPARNQARRRHAGAGGALFVLLALLAGPVALPGPAAQAQTQAPPQAQAESLSAADQSAIRDVIQGQVEAFRRDDGGQAFGLASPMIQGMFGTPEIFMDMVRQGYQPVYRPRSFDFREIVTLDGQPTQKVHVIGPDGRPVTAYYPMVRLPDGTWRINGCYLKAPEDHQA